MKKLKERWLAEDGQKVYSSILSCFRQNRKLSEITGLNQYDGRSDLRGITFPLKSNPHSLGLIQSFDFENLLLNAVDFSYATLYESVWRQCTFKNVIFYNSKLDYSKFWACQFENCTFEKAHLNNVLMNGSIKNETGHFKNVKFIDTNLKDTVYGNTLFEECSFINCKLDQVDFHASRFINCRFAGKLSEVCFRGTPVINRKLYPEAIQIPNKMENVDFSEAILESAMFLDFIDLSNCIFPISDDYIIVKKNRNQIFTEARKIIDLTWEGMNKKIGLGLIDGYYMAPKAIHNEGEVIDKHYLLLTDKEFGEKFFELIRMLNEQLNA